MSYGSFSYGSAAYGGSAAGAQVLPPDSIGPPIISSSIVLYALQIVSGVLSVLDENLHEVDDIQVRVTLETWNLLTAYGLQDATVASASTVEEIVIAAQGLLGHVEYVRLLERIELMLRRAEQLGILTDADMAAATTVAEIATLLTALNGEVDRDIYSAFFQGT